MMEVVDACRGSVGSLPLPNPARILSPAVMDLHIEPISVNQHIRYNIEKILTLSFFSDRLCPAEELLGEPTR